MGDTTPPPNAFILQWHACGLRLQQRKLFRLKNELRIHLNPFIFGRNWVHSNANIWGLQLTRKLHAAIPLYCWMSLRTDISWHRQPYIHLDSLDFEQWSPDLCARSRTLCLELLESVWKNSERDYLLKSWKLWHGPNLDKAMTAGASQGARLGLAVSGLFQWEVTIFDIAFDIASEFLLHRQTLLKAALFSGSAFLHQQ